MPVAGYGKKIKQLRFFAGYTTQKEFAQKHNFSLNTLQSLENERIKLSVNLASVLHKIFSNEGIKFDIKWLIENENSQLHLEIDEVNLEEQDLISKEIKIFSQLHKESIVILNLDNSMSPFFDKGDYIGGIRLKNSDSYDNIKGNYIIKAEDDLDYTVRKVEHVYNDLFNICVTNLKSDVVPVFRNKVQLVDIYKIIWIRKNNN